MAGDADARARVEFLTPLVKSWCTDMAVDVASTGIQIHGGMGFIEETGAAQFYRDAKILPIYEGTNGIQGMDLVFRKILRDEGGVAKEFMAQFKDVLELSQYDAMITAIDEVLSLGKAGDLGGAAWRATPLLNRLAPLVGAGLIERAAREHPDFEVYDGVSLKDASEYFRKNILP